MLMALCSSLSKYVLYSDRNHIKHVLEHVQSDWNVSSSPSSKRKLCGYMMESLKLWSRCPQLLRIYFNWWNPNVDSRAEQFVIHLSSTVRLHTTFLMWVFVLSLNEGSHLHLLWDATFLTWKSPLELGGVSLRWQGGAESETLQVHFL